MNRRQFLQRGAMATAAVVAAGMVPAAAALCTEEFATGGVVPASAPMMVGETVSESIISRETADKLTIDDGLGFNFYDLRGRVNLIYPTIQEVIDAHERRSVPPRNARRSSSRKPRLA